MMQFFDLVNIWDKKTILIFDLLQISKRRIFSEQKYCRMAYGVLRNTVRFLSIRRSEIVRARKSTIYGVVADIDNYKSFVPFCSRSELDDTKTLGKLGVQLGPASYTWNSQLTFKDDEIIAKNDSSFPLKSMNTSKFKYDYLKFYSR